MGLGEDTVVRNASLPNGVFLIGGADSYNLNMSSAPGIDNLGTLAFAEEPDVLSPAKLASFFIVYTHQTSQEELEPSAFRAMEVMLHFCVNTYEVSVTQGIATTTQLSLEPGVAQPSSSKAPILFERATASSLLWQHGSTL